MPKGNAAEVRCAHVRSRSRDQFVHNMWGRVVEVAWRQTLFAPFRHWAKGPRLCYIRDQFVHRCGDKVEISSGTAAVAMSKSVRAQLLWRCQVQVVSMSDHKDEAGAQRQRGARGDMPSQLKSCRVGLLLPLGGGGAEVFANEWKQVLFDSAPQWLVFELWCTSLGPLWRYTVFVLDSL